MNKAICKMTFAAFCKEFGINPREPSYVIAGFLMGDERAVKESDVAIVDYWRGTDRNTFRRSILYALRAGVML